MFRADTHRRGDRGAATNVRANRGEKCGREQSATKLQGPNSQWNSRVDSPLDGGGSTRHCQRARSDEIRPPYRPTRSRAWDALAPEEKLLSKRLVSRP